MAERFLPLYLGALGATPFIMGALNGFDNLLSALYSYPGGWLWGIAPGWNLAMATVCGLVGTGFFAWRGKDLA